jgi:hypothetical protein
MAATVSPLAILYNDKVSVCFVCLFVCFSVFFVCLFLFVLLSLFSLLLLFSIVVFCCVFCCCVHVCVLVALSCFVCCFVLATLCQQNGLIFSCLFLCFLLVVVCSCLLFLVVIRPCSYGKQSSFFFIFTSFCFPQQSILENHHAATAFKHMQGPLTNIAASFSVADQAVFPLCFCLLSFLHFSSFLFILSFSSSSSFSWVKIITDSSYLHVHT